MRRVFLFAGFLLILTVSSITAQVPRRSFLFKDARGELAQARARGEADVLLVIASMPDQNAQVAQAISGLGGTVQFQADEVDYIRARVPVTAVEQLVTHSAVHSIDISITGSRAFGMASDAPVLPSTKAPSTSGLSSPNMNPDTIWPPVLSDYPIRNRYSPMSDIRASDFLDSNPTYDGRGVKIAMIDMNPDPLLPELQVAVDLDGQPIPKIAVYGTALDIEEEDDGRWIRMNDIVTATDGQLLYQDTSYVAPREGTFRIAIFNEARDSLATFGGSLDNDVNRDGNLEGSSRLFGVLWDEDTNDVWVDTNQDMSFADQVALTDYNDRPEFGVFGTDDPDTPVRESVAFGVQIAQEKKLVALNLGAASHATLVVGAALASRGSDGRFDGVAPGAQLISIAEGGSAYGQIESPLISIRDHGAEVVYFEQSSNITRNYLLRDGRLVPTVIYERLIDRYDPVILSPTHNYPILGGIDDFVMARGLIGINGHESKENFFINHGVRVEHDDNLLITGGYGPMGNGALKPDVISPSNYVSTYLGFMEARVPVPGLYQLPPGYTIAGGTSTATPTAAGAVALLLSAAKQEGISYDAHRIKHAVTRGARWVPHLKPHKQGNGVISVAGAWEILKELDAGGEVFSISGRAPVKHSYSHLLATPDEGEGLFERDGWNIGDSEERTITLTRTSGPSTPMTFSVSWAGNEEGTFSAPATVTLPLNRPVPVNIRINPKVGGAHTAHFTLDHSNAPGYAYRMLFTIVAPESLDISNNFSVQSSVEVPRPGIQSFFYRIPEGAESLVVDLGWQEREVSMSISRPDTRAVRGGIIQAGQGVKQVINNPIPGVWEVRLSDIADTRTFDREQAKKKEPVPPTKATLTVSAIAAEVSVMQQETAGSVSTSTTHDLWATNRMGVFTGRLMSNPLGSARRLQLQLNEKEQQVFEVEVPPGSPALMARVFDPSDSGADLDLYVFDCTDDECTPARTDADPDGDESVIVWNPSAGKWKIAVDAYGLTSETIKYEYLDVVFNSSFGNVSVLDVPQERGQDSRWMAKAHVWSAGKGSHALDRIPFPAVLLEGREGSQSFPLGILELVRD